MVNSRRLSRIGGVVLSACVLAGISASPAGAVPADERASALWYADALKFDELQSMGATGAGVTIAVIDDAINPDVAELQGANITVKGSYCAFPDTGEVVPATSTDVARAGHGTAVTAMLVGNGTAADGGLGTRGIVPEAEVWFYGTGTADEIVSDSGTACDRYDPVAEELYLDKEIRPSEEGYFLGGPVAYAAWNAVRDGADIVVHSGADGDIHGWSSAAIEAMRHGVPLVAAAPNPTYDFSRACFPFVLNGVVTVSGIDQDANILQDRSQIRPVKAQGSENLGFVSAAWEMLVPVSKTAWEPEVSQGTSFAAPLVAGMVASGKQMYPGATANQVLQAMVRTTGGGEGLHEPKWNSRAYGYGVANPVRMLGVDPMQFPDENPVFVADFDDPRCMLTDGTWPLDEDDCGWAVVPYFDEIWPNGQESGELPGSESGVDLEEDAAVPGVKSLLVWALFGVVTLAVIVPVLVSRSRKDKHPITPNNPGA